MAPLTEQRRLDMLTRVGGALFAIGFIAAVAVVVPYFTGSEHLPTAAYLVAMVAPVGMALVLIGLVGAARARGRRFRAQR